MSAQAPFRLDLNVQGLSLPKRWLLAWRLFFGLKVIIEVRAEPMS